MGVWSLPLEEREGIAGWGGREEGSCNIKIGRINIVNNICIEIIFAEAVIFLKISYSIVSKPRNGSLRKIASFYFNKYLFR